MVRKSVFPDLILRFAVWRKRAEPDFMKLHPIYRSVEIPAGADRLR